VRKQLSKTRPKTQVTFNYALAPSAKKCGFKPPCPLYLKGGKKLTYWLILLVEETLRDIVMEKFDVTIDGCAYNPITENDGWEQVRDCWHTAVFNLDDGREMEVDFKPTLDPSYPDLYFDPLEIKPANVKLVETRMPITPGNPFTLENGTKAVFHYAESTSVLIDGWAGNECFIAEVIVEDEAISVIFPPMPHYVILRGLRFDLERALGHAEAFTYKSQVYHWNQPTAKALIASITKKIKPAIAALMIVPEL
jgi:hypothetical protein